MAFSRDEIRTSNRNEPSASDEIQIQISNLNLETEPLETVPLLFANRPEQTSRPSGWLQWTADGIYSGAGSVKNTVTYTIKHPLSSLLGLGTSAQASISAFVNPSKIDPKDIDSKWWASMSGAMKAQSIISLVFSFGVNYPVNRKFIEDAWLKLKTNSKNTFKSVGDFVDNATSIFLGLNSGMAAAAITFEAFLWITTGGFFFPALFAALSFLNSSTSRYIGIKRVFNLLRNLFNSDARVQSESIDALKHLNRDYQLELDNVLQSVRSILQNLLDQKISELLEARHHLDENDLAALTQIRINELALLAKSKSTRVENLSEIDKSQVDRIVNEKTAEIMLTKCKLNDHDYDCLFKELITKAAELETLHPDNIDTLLFNEKQTYEYVADYANTVFKLIFALVFGLSAGSIFMQKYFDAINILSKFISGQDLNESNMNLWLKRLIGVPSGIASGLLYGASAGDFPKLFFINLPSYVYSHPKEIFSTILLLVANFYASSSMQNVARGVVNREDNILGLLSQGKMKEILPHLTHAGCGFVNILSELKKRSPSPAEPNHPTYEEIIHYFENPNDHPIEHETALACSISNSKLSFFPKSTPGTAPESQRDLHQTSNSILSL